MHVGNQSRGRRREEGAMNRAFSGAARVYIEMLARGSVAAAVASKCRKHGKPTATTANATVSEISCCESGGGRSLEDSYEEVPARSGFEVRSRAVKLI